MRVATTILRQSHCNTVSLIIYLLFLSLFFLPASRLLCLHLVADVWIFPNTFKSRKHKKMMISLLFPNLYAKVEYLWKVSFQFKYDLFDRFYFPTTKNITAILFSGWHGIPAYYTFPWPLNTALQSQHKKIILMAEIQDLDQQNLINQFCNQWLSFQQTPSK